MIDPPPTITTRAPYPERGTAPLDYTALADAFHSGEELGSAEKNALGTWMYDGAVFVLDQAEIASAAATSATQASGATAWVSEGVFVAGQVVWSLVNFLPFRCILDHSGETTDPSLDPTHWVDAVGPGYAPKESPVFTGVPMAPTAALGDATGQVATTLFVENALNAFIPDPLAEAVVTADTDSVIFELSGHDAYRLVIKGAVPATTLDELLMFFGDAVNSFDILNSYNYRHIENTTLQTGSLATSILLAQDVAAEVNRGGLFMIIDIWPSPDGSQYSLFCGQGAAWQDQYRVSGSYARNANATHLRLNFQAGDIAEGVFTLYPLTGG